jgi:hypothetical protein
MNTLEFVALVREMRDAQKEFFKRRLPVDLARAKAAERDVDAALNLGVTLFATETLGTPAEPDQLGMFDEPDAADLLDLSDEQRPTDKNALGRLVP